PEGPYCSTRLSIKPGYMFDVTSVPMSSEMISRIFGRVPLGVSCAPAAEITAAAVTSAAAPYPRARLQEVLIVMLRSRRRGSIQRYVGKRPSRALEPPAEGPRFPRAAHRSKGVMGYGRL